MPIEVTMVEDLRDHIVVGIYEVHWKIHIGAERSLWENVDLAMSCCCYKDAMIWGCSNIGLSCFLFCRTPAVTVIWRSSLIGALACNRCCC
jgi:hypothetical protein